MVQQIEAENLIEMGQVSPNPATPTKRKMTRMEKLERIVSKAERRLGNYLNNKNRVQMLIIFFAVCYFVLGVSLYLVIHYRITFGDIARFLRGGSSSYEEDDDSEGGMPPEMIQQMLNDGIPPQVIQQMLESGARPMRVQMVVKRPTSFRGGMGGGIEDLFAHDPFLAAMMAKNMNHMQSGAMMINPGMMGGMMMGMDDSSPENMILNMMQQKMQHDMMMQQMMQRHQQGQQGGQEEEGLPEQINLNIDDGNGHHIKVQIKTPQEALDGFFPKMSAEDLLKSGAFDDIIGEIIKDVNERDARGEFDEKKAEDDSDDAWTTTGDDASSTASEESAAASLDEDNATPLQVIPQKRILIMASEEDGSGFEALKENMREKFSEKYDGVDVKNYPTPMDFIESEEFQTGGYHDIRDLGVFPKIMHEVDENSGADQSHTHGLLSAFCRKVETLLLKEENCEFTCVNKIKPEVLDHVIEDVEDCHNILGKLQKNVENRGSYVKTSWRRTEL